jgi:hypothetical protein
LLAAGVLVGLPLHLHFSRMSVTNIVVPLMFTLVLWLTFRALERGRVTDYLWLGLVGGGALYTYLGNRLALTLAVLVLVWNCAFRRGFWRAHRLHLLVFALAVAVVGGPVAYLLLRHPDIAWAPYNGWGIFQTGWLWAEAANSGRSIAAILLDQLARSSLVFVSQGAPMGFYNSPRPYLPMAAAIFFGLGLGTSLLKLRDSRHLTLQAWFWSVVIMGSALTIQPPTSERLVGSLPPMAMFVALGLTQTAAILKRMQVAALPTLRALAVGVVLVTGLQGIGFYFGEYRQARYFEFYPEEVQQEVSQAMLPLASDYRLYVVAEPYIRPDDFHIREYLGPAIEVTFWHEGGPDMLAASPGDKGAYFVATPNYLAELQAIVEQYPGGSWTEVPRRPVQGQASEVLYYAYELTPQQLALTSR